MKFVDNEVLNNLIIYGGGLITALGLNKIVPAIISYWEKRTEDARNRRKAEAETIDELKNRIDVLEEKLTKSQAFEVQTRSTLNAMIPLMKEMMRDHPHYVQLLERLEENIVGNPSAETPPAA